MLSSSFLQIICSDWTSFSSIQEELKLMIAKALTKFSGREKSASIKPVRANNEIFSFKAECTETNPATTHKCKKNKLHETGKYAELISTKSAS